VAGDAYTTRVACEVTLTVLYVIHLHNLSVLSHYRQQSAEFTVPITQAPNLGASGTYNSCSYCVIRRQRSQCKECGGAGICEHRRQRTANARSAAAHPSASTGGGVAYARSAAAQLSASTGGSVTTHQCKQCGGAGICEHRRQRSLHVCKECGGAGFCEHGRWP
jgi:hypothetical protein